MLALVSVKKFGMKIETTATQKNLENNNSVKLNKKIGDEESESDEEETETETKEVIDKSDYLNIKSKECSFVESSFFSLWNSALHDSEFFKISLCCYLGLSSALLKRSEKISVAIRTVEKEYELKFTVLDVSQRQGDDFEDLLGSLLDPDRPQNKDDIKVKTGATFFFSRSSWN